MGNLGCGFKCAKNSLMILNVFYIIVGIILAAIGGHLITSNKLTSLPIIGGIVACGIFLIAISVVGIYGAARHHQVLLFFYMVILFLIFFIQFVIACVCLSISHERQVDIATVGWKHSFNSTRSDVQRAFDCCGFETYEMNPKNETEKEMGHPTCDHILACMKLRNGTICEPTAVPPCCTTPEVENCGCLTCKAAIDGKIEGAFSTAGLTSLFFSFTEVIGGVLAWRYRNLYANGLTS